MLRVEKGLRLDRDTAGHAPRGAEEELACPGPDGALEACGRQKGAGGFQAGWEKQGQRPYAQGHLQPQVTGQGPCPWGPRSARWESHQAGLREPGKGQAAVGQPPGGRDWDLQRRQHTGHTCEHSHTHRLSRHTLLHIHSHAHRHTPKSQHATGTAANVYTHTHARTHKPHMCVHWQSHAQQPQLPRFVDSRQLALATRPPGLLSHVLGPSCPNPCLVSRSQKIRGSCSPR